MEHIKNLTQDRNFIKKTVSIMLPIAAQNLLNNLLNLVDTWMIVKLGEKPIAAVGLANKVFFVFVLLMFGICSGSSVLASQYFGKREMINIKRVLRIAVLFGIGASLLFTIPAVLFPKAVMGIFTPNQETIAIGASYLAVVAISYPLTAITNVYVSILRSMNYVIWPVFITSAAILVNVVLDYGFIFGKLGLPELGVAGAALATVIARIVELTALLIIVYMHRVGDGGIGDFIRLKYQRTGENELPFLHKAFFIKYIITAAPVIFNEFLWGLGVTVYSYVYGHMSDEAAASITITNSIEQIATLLFFGMCHAAAIILGNEMGAGELKKAEEHARLYLILQLVLSSAAALLTFLGKDLFISIFGVSDQLAGLIRLNITVFACYMPFKMLNTLFIVAILRSGGDTIAALLIDLTGVWLIGIPMAVLGGLILHLPIYIVYAMIMIEEIYKMIIGFIRYRKKKWLRNIVSGTSVN